MMKVRKRLLCAAMALLMLAGCGAKAPAGNGSTQQPEVAMERVPTVDAACEAVLNDFDIVGAFHNGAAFAANYVVPKTEEELEAAGGAGSYAVECGYVTLDGAFTPLYTVPFEYELLGPEGDFFDTVRNVGTWFIESFEGSAIATGTTEAFLKEFDGECTPYATEQKAIDQTFAVGDNGWVPYYENGLWGYCDLAGNVTLAPAYDFVEPFYDGKALVCMYDGVNYTWSVIDETGAQQVSLEPCDLFAVRQPGSAYFVLCDKMGEGKLYRMDGTQIDPEQWHGEYLDSGTNIMTRSFSKRVYDADGNFLYEDDRIQFDAGVQDGCTAYSDGTYCGILGSDGAVRCEARFMEILHLAPEGFYAREQSKTELGLYDYDGNLLEEAPACAWITESTGGGYAVYDGAGNVLADYPSDASYVERNGDTFFTQDGFAYLRLNDTQFVTTHIVFEERPAETEEKTAADTTAEKAASSPAASGKLTVQQGTTLEMQWVHGTPWDFAVTEYDSMPLEDRVQVAPQEGLSWYYTPEHELIVCNKELRTVFAVPQEGVEYTRKVRGDGLYTAPYLNYLGEGLWRIYTSEWNKAAKMYATAEYVFNENGEIIWSHMEQTNTFPHAGMANEGYFSAGAQIFSLTGEPLEIHAEGEPMFSQNAGFFSGGLAPTGYGYVDTQGNVVFSFDMLKQALNAYPGAAGQTPTEIASFEGDLAALWAKDENGNGFAYWIDRNGVVVREISEQERETMCDANAQAERAAEIMAAFEQDTSRGAFRIVTRREGNSIITPSGAEVFAPEGFTLTGETVQWDEAYAFVQLRDEDSSTYMLLDAQGNFYPSYAWYGVTPAQDGSANVWEKTGDSQIITMTHITVTAE